MNEIDFPFPARSAAIVVQSDPETFSRLFREGEIVKGKVIGHIDSHHALLRFRGHTLLVETRVPLGDQEENLFQIETTTPQVILRLLPEGMGRESPVSLLKKYLSHDIASEDLVENMSGIWQTGAKAFPSAIRETVHHVLKLLQTFTLEQLPNDPAALKGLMVRSGLFLESRLRQHMEGTPEEPVESILKGDLKAILLELKSKMNASLPSMATGDEKTSLVEQLGKGVDQLVQKLELVQLLNLVQTGPQEKMFLLLPFWFSNHPQFLELNISLPREGTERGQEEESLSVLFLLHLPQLGRMTIDVRMKGRGLYCLFKVYDPQVSKCVEPFLPDLKRRLSGLGFDPNLHLSTEPPQESVSLISEVGKDLESLLSIVV